VDGKWYQFILSSAVEIGKKFSTFLFIDFLFGFFKILTIGAEDNIFLILQLL